MAKILSDLLQKNVTDKEVKEVLVELEYMEKKENKYKLTAKGESHCKKGKFPSGTRYIYFNDWYEDVIAEIRAVIEERKD